MHALLPTKDTREGTGRDREGEGGREVYRQGEREREGERQRSRKYNCNERQKQRLPLWLPRRHPPSSSLLRCRLYSLPPLSCSPIPSPVPEPLLFSTAVFCCLSHSLSLRLSVAATSNCLNSALFLYNSFPHEEQQQHSRSHNNSHSSNYKNYKNKCKKIVGKKKKLKRTEINEKKCALCDESRF